MQKIINVIAISSGVVSLTVVIGGVSLYANRGKIIDSVKSQVMEQVSGALGGALGAGAQQAMIQESPAARMLAKVQTQGELSYADQQALENILADTYSNTLGM